MAFCMKCGANLLEGATFCTSCGAQQGAPAAGGPPAAQPAATSSMTPNVAGALAYVLGLITGIIFLVIEPYKDDKFVRFHAFQSIFFHVGAIVFWIVWSIISAVLGYFLGMLGVLLWGLGMLIGLGFIGLWVFLMYKAYNNERFMIPFIGQLATKQAG